MSVAPRHEAPVLTYEAYLAEGEVMARYDIIDGIREPMTNPTRRHQRILRRVARLLEDYEAETRSGQVLVAPIDVLISRRPLRTRQPDVLFIGNARLAQNPPETDAAPLEVAPELVVEILSPNETRRARSTKLADYCAVDVRECWIIDPATETVEVLRLSADGPHTVAVFGRGMVVRSGFLPVLRLQVDRIFEP